VPVDQREHTSEDEQPEREQPEGRRHPTAARRGPDRVGRHGRQGRRPLPPPRDEQPAQHRRAGEPVRSEDGPTYRHVVPAQVQSGEQDAGYAPGRRQGDQQDRRGEQGHRRHSEGQVRPADRRIVRRADRVVAGDRRRESAGPGERQRVAGDPARDARSRPLPYGGGVHGWGACRTGPDGVGRGIRRRREPASGVEAGPAEG